MLALLSQSGNPLKEAREQLIEDRLKMQAAARFGIEVTQEDLAAGTEEFAARGEMKPEEFIKVLREGGVERETFEDFVISGIAWRTLVRARFGGRVQISDREIDQAMATGGERGGVRVLISEIILPAPPERAEQANELALQLSQLTSIKAFANAARRYSAVPSGQQGGRVEWLPLANLPPQLRPMILELRPGEVTDPVPIPNAVAVFQLRAIDEITPAPRAYAAVEYAALYLPGGRSPETLAEAARIRNTVDRCDDLYGIAKRKGMPEAALDRVSSTPGEVPRDIALELARLDQGEVSTNLTANNGQTLIFLMMCGRSEKIDAETSREDVAAALRNRRLQGFAESYLDQLRAEARIIE